MATIRTTPHGSVYSRSGTSRLWIRFTAEDGSEVRRSSGSSDLDEALAFLEAEYKRQSEVTFRAAVVDFFDVRKRTLKPNTLRSYQDNLKTLDKFFSRSYLTDITRSSLQKFVATRRRTVSDSTVRREMAFLSSVYSHAVEAMPGGPEINPVLSFSKRSLKDVTRTRWLTVVEFQRLLAACETDMHRHIIEFACLTGMRSGELLALRKSMIQLDNRRLILPGTLTKNGKPRVVPLAPAALRTAEKLCEMDTGDLFFHYYNRRGEPRPYISFRQAYVQIRERADLKDVRFHDLRHTFASWYVQAGGRLETLQKLLGHGSMQMVQRYAYLDMDSAHDQADEIFSHSFRTKGDMLPHSDD